MNKDALKKFLKERRDGIAPESLGLTRPAARQGRRSLGLAQDQVDELLNRARNTYQKLEAGRYKNPPVDLLRDIACLYQLNEQEWTALCRYARGEDPPTPLYDTTGYAVPAAWEDAVTRVVAPAYVTDASWTVLAHNQPFEDLFIREPPANTMRWMLVSGREQLIDWEGAWAPLVMPQLKAALAQRPQDQVLRGIETDVCADPASRALYEKGGASIHPDGHERPIRHAVEGDGWVTMCAAQPMASPGARFMILIFRPDTQPPMDRPPLLKAP
ncbi:XRE family transcriptional regulator (plasmid) [Streptomyces seoulensis]|uniref:XRE family transcriptional regulator n=1 Tax=Streptomyces seoulensis TaxID=73044 RepID=A0A4P6U341_STRSO|nr:helix-turn-helix domain-containing protein [Streptomyces seoulensis]QBJ94469.1 XRE family transcriptional regulator [Streptomyces seoulensis]